MTTRTVYVPVPIESTEQAEALPIGTVLTARTPRRAAIKDIAGHWLFDGERWPRDDADMIGWTALVPVEADEQYAVHWNEGDEPYPAGDFTIYHHSSREEALEVVADAEPWEGTPVARTRLVTRWEDA